MISREEALKLFNRTTNKAVEYDAGVIVANVAEASGLISNIFDSIGSCGECDRWEQFAPTDGRESSLGQCFLGNDMDNIWGIDDYCSRFQRKTNEL